MFLCGVPLAAGCQADDCERLCTRSGTLHNQCLNQWPVDWDDLDAVDRDNFQESCRTRWSEVQSDLESRELDDALEQCQETLTDLNDMDEDGSVCDQLRAIYLDD